MKWNKENVFEESKKYKSRSEFKKGCVSAYDKARKNGWLQEMNFSVCDRRGSRKWNDDNVISESKKYKSRSEFSRGSRGAYGYALKYDLLKQMTWLLPLENHKHKGRHCVYCYLDSENLWAYIGLTIDIVLRHKKHLTDADSSVYRHFTDNDKNIPQPIILIEKIREKEAQYWEDWFVKEYKKQGFNILNKGVTGVGCGSLGGNSHILKWNKKTLFEESKKYKTIQEFYTFCRRGYDVARQNKWIEEMVWLSYKIRQPKYWTKDRVFEESKKYVKRNEFKKNSSRAYQIARKNGWLDEMTWFEIKYHNWNLDSIIEESKRYHSRNDFKKNNRGAYCTALKNGWMDIIFPKCP